MEQEDLYSLLQCSPSASDDALRSCFRKAALQTHPDKVPEGSRSIAERSFKRIQQAYESIVDSRKKVAIEKCQGALSPAKAFQQLFGDVGIQSSFAQGSLGSSSSLDKASSLLFPTSNSHRPNSFYQHTVHQHSRVRANSLGAAGTSGSIPKSTSSGSCDAGSGPSSLESASSAFHSFPCGPASTSQAAAAAGLHAGMKRKMAGCRQMEQVLTLSLEELYKGCTKRMLCTRQIHDGSSQPPKLSQEVLEVSVIPGWREGTRITFHGKGDQLPGVAAADVVFVVREEIHPRYERKGNDLFTTISLPLVTALTGGKVDLVLLDGRKIPLPICDVIDPHCERLLQGEGMPISRCPGKKGDLHVRFNIIFPKVLSPLQQVLVRSAFAEPGQCGAEQGELAYPALHPSSSGVRLDEAALCASAVATRAFVISQLNQAAAVVQ